MLLEHLAERRSVIEDVTTNIAELEKETQIIIEQITQFWGSLAQDEELHQLDIQLGEVEAHFTTLRGYLKMMPTLAKVTKALELKELQQRVNKVSITHQ